MADYFDVDPMFGTLADADQLIATAHELGLRVVVDVVPNQTSDEHAWFQEALASAPGSRERARYANRPLHSRDISVRAAVVDGRVSVRDSAVVGP